MEAPGSDPPGPWEGSGANPGAVNPFPPSPGTPTQEMGMLQGASETKGSSWSLQHTALLDR